MIQGKVESERDESRMRYLIAAQHACWVLNAFRPKNRSALKVKSLPADDLVQKVLDIGKKPQVQKQPAGWDRDAEFAAISAEAEQWLEKGRGESR